MACPPVRGDNPRALASGLSYVQVDKHGITTRILFHLHQCSLCKYKDGKGGIILRLAKFFFCSLSDLFVLNDKFHVFKKSWTCT